jgi:hypothetical protein
LIYQIRNRGGRYLPPLAFQSRNNLSIRSDFAITIAAINRSVTAGLEGDFGVFTTLGTGCRKHLSRRSVTVILVTVGFPCLAAFRAAFRLVGVALALEELLILDAENKGSAAIGTLERLVFETHWMASSHNIS